MRKVAYRWIAGWFLSTRCIKNDSA